MSAPREPSAGPVRSDSLRTPQALRKNAKIPKPVNVTHGESERALRTWTKRQRADNISEKQNSPKPVNQACEPHICKKLFCRLTPELSRPVAGRRTRASVAHSTWPTPRHGVGLNELLGGGGHRCKSNPGALAEKPKPGCLSAPNELSPAASEAERLEPTTNPKGRHRYRSGQAQRMRYMSAHCELAEAMHKH
jgi:hypothetical protein